ncbi:zincin [Anaeromyces robustus]|uniref:Zincin n=1 Tax=Anaeromyces robustus TaxID=1754192 RepID=A0A1Y1X0Y8_9FUNG|nr:zincin [Anaeromyces robustus]|eukprot:ORX79467.1 zincin [Anaeromyces robustus]
MNGLVNAIPAIPVVDPFDPPEYDESLFPTEECLTEACYNSAKRIITNMDISVDPCNDFYQFSCGGFIKENPLKKGQSVIYDFIDVESWNLYRSIITNEYKPSKNYTIEEQKYDEEVFNKLRNVYNTCIDVDSIEKKRNKPLLNIIEEFNILKNSKNYFTVDGLTDLLVKLHTRGVPFLFDIGNVFLDTFDINTDKYILAIVGNGSSLAGEMITDKYIERLYRNYVKSTLKLVFEGSNDRDLDKMTDAIVKIEIKLAEYINSDEKEMKEMTISELNKKFPYINWKVYFERMLKKHNVQDEITLQSKILNISPRYFDDLDDIMWSFSIEQLAYYAEFTLIRKFIGYAASYLKKPEKDFLSFFTDEYSQDIPRQSFCEGQVDEMLGWILGKYFVENKFTDITKKDAVDTIEYVKQAMVNRIPQMAWLDEKTKEAAIRKVFLMTNKIGFPDFIMDPKKLAEDYEEYETVPDDYFTNMINYEYYSLGHNLKLYNKNYDKEHWYMTPQTFNAYYSANDNSMNFPAGIFQPPCYYEGDPDYINYGANGGTAGHELTHGFDDEGRNYDAEGKEVNWWTDSDSAKFNELAQCFIDQYDKYYVTDKRGRKYYLDGEKTLGENLADSGGVYRAYEAWLLSVEEHKKKEGIEGVRAHNQILPGLSQYSVEQMFYIGYAQSWCMNTSKEYNVRIATSDVHSPAVFRVNGVVQNMEHFSKVFNCPVGSPMNPKDKCLLW